MADKNSGEHHSKLKGAALGALAGKLVGGKKATIAGAAIGARHQEKKNKEGR
jgi:uncharacterized membrane protein YebE (DUF533 family)